MTSLGSLGYTFSYKKNQVYQVFMNTLKRKFPKNEQTQTKEFIFGCTFE